MSTKPPPTAQMAFHWTGGSTVAADARAPMTERRQAVGTLLVEYGL